MKRKDAALLLLLTFAAVLIHGYHPRAEDAEIYVSGIVKILHPAYYPFGREFFEANSHLTLFPNLIAWTVRLTHLSFDWTLFVWHFVSIFLFLLACWRIAEKCFPTAPGRWCAVAMVAALLTLPVAGTALYLFDQYLNPRDLSIFSTLFAIDAAIEKKHLRMAAWLIFTAIIHPLMAVFSVAFILLLAFVDRIKPATATSSVAFFPLDFLFKHPSPAYWQTLRSHRYYYLLRWEWFEWLGIVGPLALLWWFSCIARRSGRLPFARLARAVFFFGLFFFLAALVVTIPRQFEILDLYQPMRSLQLVYVFLVIFSGGLLGESLLKNKPLRWLLLFIPVSAAMCFAQFQLFPGTRHVEWPGMAPTNPWEQAFVWVRGNTPVDAIFALDPNYMALPGEDNEGFRAIAERSRLADANKDWSVSALYPGLSLAEDCLAQTRAASGWKNFGIVDFERLKKTYGVNWVVLQQPGVAGLTCPYQNRAVLVCRVN